jgi:phosphonoacetate hydrolase
VSIACGAWPEEHGIVANSYFNEQRGKPVYMNAAELIRCPTIFRRAAERFHLVPDLIGDIIATGDRQTMFGEMDTAYEDLPATYRAHGSLYEMRLPLVIYNSKDLLPSADDFKVNLDLTRFLYR